MQRNGVRARAKNEKDNTGYRAGAMCHVIVDDIDAN